MKKLIITFSLSISIIVSIVLYNMYKGNEMTENITFTKTLVQNDSVGRPSITLTFELIGSKWVESEMKEKFYDDNSTTTIISAFVNGTWEKKEKIVEEIGTKTIYKSAYNEWKFESKTSTSIDLSEDNGIFHDIEFDKYGNLISDATYLWTETNNLGLKKDEYIYSNNGKLAQKISYVWRNGNWQKDLVADLLYQQNHN